MKFSEKAFNLAWSYENLSGNKPSKKTKTGCDFVTKNRYVEVKSFKNKPRYLSIYSSIFEHLSKTKTGYKRYYVYVIYDEKHPKMMIVPPKLIFKGTKVKKIFDIKLGYFWNKMSINISPKIYKGLESIDLRRFLKDHGEKC